MRTEQLRALAQKANYQLDAETEAFFRLVEQAMKTNIKKKIQELEDYLEKEGKTYEADIVWLCSLLVKDGMTAEIVGTLKSTLKST